ncbi:putative ring-cleaving dioxygenase MhqO [Desulfosarcina widdelii]|uniref:Putative ring-cleaving dioxygenase MhqO n=1 Tax=Desulfosarcina widdelii TaxID=947919 RepID=A0A5K7Z5Q1_9BACT|nr:ring-cleaving dioxygenase [Desulfosarcina widdelii]BBO74971.1 putative ring-cleaving dioxygenase MhqO [Desulfosarcina widdelii]
MAPINDSMAVAGIHHITAVASSAAENLDFYTGVLQLRLVKKTVNFDDPYTYHLYYGDQTGRPGTILTFFPWEQVRPGTPGAGSVSAVAFAVPPGALNHWCDHLTDCRIPFDETARFGENVIHFTDPHGLPLELVAQPPARDEQEASAEPEIETAIQGFHSATVLLNRMEDTEALIAKVMGMVPVGREGSRYRFAMDDLKSAGQLFDVVIDPSAPPVQPGGGTVHHIAFRTRDSQEQIKWQAKLRDHGLQVTEVRDRKYFQSIYFREPGGVLFEIATDPPGFTVDEAPHSLGRDLKLPGQYEPLRTDIKAKLPSLMPD